MPDFVQMPQLSDTMTEGTVVKWLVKAGDKVEVSDPLAEIETDKATMEMVAFDEGIVGAIYVDEGTTAPLGEVLAVIVEEGEEVPDKPDSTAAPEIEKPEQAGEDKENQDQSPTSKPSFQTWF